MTKLSSPDSVADSVASCDRDQPSTPIEDATAPVAMPHVVVTNEPHLTKQRSSHFLKLTWFIPVIALGLHGLLLFWPIELAQKPPTKPPEKSVRTTQLQPLKKPPGSKRLPNVAVPKKPNLVRSTQPKSVTAPVQPSKQARESKTGSSDANPWQDFPQYPGAVIGCFNLPACAQASDSIDRVTTFFQTELKAKKYLTTLTNNESDRRIYQVSRNNLTQYLNIFVSKGSTVYVLASKALTLAELTKAKAVPPEIDAIFAGVDAQEVTPANFAQPDLFYTAGQLRSEIIDARLVKNLDSSTTAETFFDAFISGNLQSSQFNPPEESQPYAGGNVYLATKGKTSFYINIIPTKDKEGGIIILWQKQPK